MKKLILPFILSLVFSGDIASAKHYTEVDSSIYNLIGDFTLNAKRSDPSCIGYLRNTAYPRDLVPRLDVQVIPGSVRAVFQLNVEDGDSMAIYFEDINRKSQKVEVASTTTGRVVRRKMNTVWDSDTQTLFKRYTGHKSKNVTSLALQNDGSLVYSGPLFNNKVESCVFQKTKSI